MRSLVFSLLVPVLCAAQTPTITVDQPHFDFGRLNTDAKAVHRFKVTNTGKADLNISRLNPSCGCTSTVIGEWTLHPDQSTHVEATFNPSGFRGHVHKSIQVVSNDPANPTVNLTFEAEIVREINPSTESVFFQDVVRSVPRKSSVKFSSGNDQPVHLTEAKASGAPWLATAIRQDGHHAWLDVVLDGRHVPPGRMVGTDVVLVKTDNPRMPALNITVQWELRPAVTADPVRVAWVENPGKDHVQKVMLKQVDGKPFRILSAKTTNPLVKVEGLAKGAAPQHELTVVLAGSAKAGLYNEKVILTTDSPDQPELELRVAASLR